MPPISRFRFNHRPALHVPCHRSTVQRLATGGLPIATARHCSRLTPASAISTFDVLLEMAKKKKSGGNPRPNPVSANISQNVQRTAQVRTEAPRAGDVKYQGRRRKGRLRAHRESQNLLKTSPEHHKDFDKTNAMSRSVIEKYGPKESQIRLVRDGFHPGYTSKGVAQVNREWRARIFRKNRRPSIDEFWKNEMPAKLPLFRGFLCMARKLPEPPDLVGLPGIGGSDADAASNVLEKILTHGDIGSLAMIYILSSGAKSTMKLACTSRRLWKIVVSHVKVWNSVSGGFEQEGYPDAFIAVAPKYTIFDVAQVRNGRPYTSVPLSVTYLSTRMASQDWRIRAMGAEGHIMRNVQALKSACGSATAPFWNLADIRDRAQKPEGHEDMSDWLFHHIRALKPFPDNAFFKGFRWQADPFQQLPRHWPFQPTMLYCTRRLRAMMREINRRRQGIRVLQFHKTHLFNRNILAIILRACPNVEMVGIYDCPLIHMGDVICLLDLIHEINVDRRREGRAEIKAFDFYPCFEKGMAYQHENAATYGISWEAHPLEIVQRGFFQIVLEAFLKAKGMGLDLLFSQHGSFYDFLHRVPNAPFAIPGFLDALNRYLDLDSNDDDFKNKKKQAMYDILKPVRLDLEEVGDDWPTFYMDRMGRYQEFCCSCGYETFQAFFSRDSREARYTDRVCSKCILQAGLDAESDHLKQEKRWILSGLMGEWDPKRHNLDAPIAQGCEDLYLLRSTLSEMPPPPPLFVDNDGNIRGPHFKRPLCRDKKLPQDSLQNLPSLSELVEGPEANDLWFNVVEVCAHGVDVRTRIVQQLDWDYPVDQEKPLVPCFSSTRFDLAKPDHPMEIQRSGRGRNGPPSLHYGAALERWNRMREKEW